MHVARLILPVLLAAPVAGAQLPVDSARREAQRGYAIGILDTTDQELSTAPTLPHALQARLAGVSVSQGQGFLGSSSRVWLRGPSSLMVNTPLLIIDGARTHSADPQRPFTAREMPSRLEDIDMETVERVEVLRGVAASALYGPGASKGVILVTTKHGAPGPTRVTAFAESGPSLETTAFPANFGTIGVSTANGATVDCPLAQQAAGSCTPTTRRSWNPLESVSPFRTGWTNGAGLTASGSAGLVTYFVAGSHDRAEGVYEIERSRATSGRASLSASPTPTIDLRLTGGQRVDQLRRPIRPWINAGLFGASVDDPVNHGYNGITFDDAVSPLARKEAVRRTTAAFNARWHARPWLQTSATLGYDRLGVKSDLSIHEEIGFPNPGDFGTRIDRSLDRPETRTGTLGATASYLFRGLNARSTIGFQYIREDDQATTFQGVVYDEPDDFFGEWSGTWSTAGIRRTTKGAYLQQHVAWHDRLFVTGGIRVDRPTIFDVDIEDMYSRSLDVSWIGLDSRSPAASTWLSGLRLRAAYGRGGGFSAIPMGPIVMPGEESSAELEMGEVGTEIEVGADASLLGDRLRAEATWFRATTERGFGTNFTFQGAFLAQVAEVRSSGVELSMDATLFRTASFGWELGLIHSTRDNEITRLGVTPFMNATSQMARRGSSIGEYFESPYTFVDANGDGLVAPSEVTGMSADDGPLGTPFAEYETALRTAMTVGRHVRLSAVLDHRGGARLFNQTARARCRTRCEEQHDPATPLAEQARSVAASTGPFSQLGFIEDADYTKLREVRVALTLPQRVARLGGASGAHISVTGRNLYTWTPYKGLDPEIVSARYDAIEASDNFYQPTLRSFVARLDLTW
jgi:TonB-dependent SusC/RagA subfamily outer membrane receptor